MLPKNTWGGEFQFRNGTAVFSPLELNLHRLNSKDMVAFFWFEQWGGRQNGWLSPHPAHGIHVATPRSLVRPYYMPFFSDKGGILEARTTSVFLTPMCSSVCGT